VVFKLIRVVCRIVAVKVMHGDNGDLRVGRGVVELLANRIEVRDCLGREDVRKIAYVVSGLRQTRNRLCTRVDGKERKKGRQQWRNHSKACAAKAFHSFSLYVGGALTVP
jgi:hypothetical protein